MAFKIVTIAIFIVVMLILSRLIARPIVESYGLVGTLVGLAILFAIGFWIDARDKRREQSRR